jgi:hypothetical protein
MDNINEWLQQTEARAALVSEAYRLELSRLWWANLMFVVVPAVLSTAAAIVAALPESKTKDFAIFSLEIPPAAAFAGIAAILITIHKALKCDEYQAECLRLAQIHQSIAISAGSALSRPEDERASHQERIARRLEELTESAKARLSTAIIRKAEKRSGTKFYDQFAAPRPDAGLARP